MEQERLIIFTRYPEPGRTKTRLIKALGAEGAALLQRQMTEYTLSKVRNFQQKHTLSLEVRFSSGNLMLMERWLGADVIYQPQGEGDLGSRLERSLSDAFQAGINRVVIIGTDCPGLSAHHIEQAFRELYTHDLVLGPAVDGGYYLIGFGYFIPELFCGINWGTAEVLQQTINIATKLNLSVAYLTELADVDRPEDLAIWEREQIALDEAGS